MASYVEEEVWKCPKHPSKRRRNGICPTCLHDRLVTLCPLCANVRPCACLVSTPSSSSSSSFGRRRVVDGEPSFRRSRSVAIPFLRSRNTGEQAANGGGSVKTPSFLSILRRSRTKRCDPAEEKEGFVDENFDRHNRIEDFAKMVTRSRSVSAVSTPTAKGKFWHFPVFRSSKAPKVVVQDRSPLHRG